MIIAELKPSQQELYYSKVVAPLLTRFADYRMMLVDICNDIIRSHISYLYADDKTKANQLIKILKAYKTNSFVQILGANANQKYQELVSSRKIEMKIPYASAVLAHTTSFLNYIVSMFYVTLLDTDPSMMFKNHVVLKAYMACMLNAIGYIQPNKALTVETAAPIVKKLMLLAQAVNSDMYKYVDSVALTTNEYMKYLAPYLSSFKKTQQTLYSNNISNNYGYLVINYATDAIHIDDHDMFTKQHYFYWDLASYRKYLLSVCSSIMGAGYTNMNFKKLLAWLYCKRIAGKSFNGMFGFGGEAAKNIKDVTIDDVNDYMILMDNKDRRQPYKGFTVQLTSPIPPYTYKDILSMSDYMVDEALPSLGIGDRYPLYDALKNQLIKHTDTSIGTFDFIGDYDDD